MTRNDMNRSELRKRVLRSLKSGYSLPMPKEPEGAGGMEFPSDLTRLTDVEVRQQMSYWKAMAGYTNTVLARSMIDEMAYKREVRDFERRFKFENKPDRNAPMWEVEAPLADNAAYQHLRGKLDNAEAMVVILKSLRDSQEGYFTVASRELTARMGEHQREHNGGSGAH